MTKVLQTEIDVCNIALSLCGVPPISSFNDSARQAQDLKISYPVYKEHCLCINDWKFATFVTDLNINSAITDKSVYSYIFSLPFDYLRTVALHEEGYKYTIKNYNLYTNSSKAKISYIRNMDEQYFPAYFKKYLSSYIAMHLALSLGDEMKKSELLQKYMEMSYKEAVKADNLSVKTREFTHYSIITGRNNYV